MTKKEMVKSLIGVVRTVSAEGARLYYSSETTQEGNSLLGAADELLEVIEALCDEMDSSSVLSDIPPELRTKHDLGMDVKRDQNGILWSPYMQNVVKENKK